MNRFQSDSLDQIAPALAAAQAEMPNVVADEKVVTPKYSYCYADLATIRELTAPVLAKHGLAIVQLMVPFDPPILGDKSQVFGALRTTIVHTSGQWIAGEHPIGGDWGNAQAISGATTTARRQNLKSACGIAEIESAGPAAPNGNGRRAVMPAMEPSPAKEIGRGDAYEEFDQLPMDQGSQRLANREERKEAYRETFQPTQPQEPVRPARRQPVNGDGQQHQWPPRSGRGLYAATRDTPAFQWFDDYGAEKQLPNTFADWTNDEVAQACAAYDLETQRRASSNGAAAGARK